jgi:hypothetical protein
MTRFPSKARTSLPALACVALGLYACSLQDFEYLQEGEAGAPSGGKGGAAGSSSGSSGTGGSSGSNAGSSNPSAGGSGDEAGQGGEAGVAGASGEGGAPVGGTGGTSGGAPSAGQGGEGGAPTGAGGDVGTGATAGVPSDGGAGGEPPVVGRSELENPGFELGLVGWTIDPASAALPANRYIYTQAPNPTNGTGLALATWHMTAEYQIFVSQTLTGLEPGTYTFKGMLSTQSTREAYLFARNCGGEEVREIIYPVSFEWFEVAIQSFPVSQDSCEVGLFVHGMKVGDAMPDWLNADNFSFEKDP